MSLGVEVEMQATSTLRSRSALRGSSSKIKNQNDLGRRKERKSEEYHDDDGDDDDDDY